MPILPQLESWVQAVESETLGFKRSTTKLKSGMQSMPEGAHAMFLRYRSFLIERLINP